MTWRPIRNQLSYCDDCDDTIILSIECLLNVLTNQVVDGKVDLKKCRRVTSKHKCSEYQKKWLKLNAAKLKKIFHGRKGPKKFGDMKRLFHILEKKNNNKREVKRPKKKVC